MYKSILTFGFLFTLVLSSSAFPGPRSHSSANRALEETRKLTDALRLNEMDIIQVINLYVVTLEETELANTMYSNNPSLRTAKIREIENRFNAQIVAFLTPAQKADFSAYLANTEILVVSTTN